MRVSFEVFPMGPICIQEETKELFRWLCLHSIIIILIFWLVNMCGGLCFLCRIFCWPPCPGRIASKLAFLPPSPTYRMIEDKEKKTVRMSIKPTEFINTQGSNLNRTHCSLIRTRRGNQIPCVFIRATTHDAKYTVLYSHGNAVDLGATVGFCLYLSSHLGCNMLCYDYSGYGVSSGRPSEKNLYADIDSAWSVLQCNYGASSDSVILYGQSLGSIPTAQLASKTSPRAVILHSPVPSALRVLCPGLNKSLCFDVFRTADRVPKIKVPTLFIHGTRDEIIDFRQAQKLYDKCQRPVSPLWLEGAGHNGIELYDEYLQRLKRFIQIDLVNA